MEWSKKFFEENLKGIIFEEIEEDIILSLISCNFRDDSIQSEINSVSKNEFTKLVKIIQMVEKIISGEPPYGDKDLTSINVVKSVISFVELDKIFGGNIYYPIEPLESDENARKSLFPVDSIEGACDNGKDPKNLYAKLKKQFLDRIRTN